MVLLPWYIFNETRILLGLNSTNALYLMSAERHSGRSYLERVIRAVEILDIYATLFPFVLVTLPLFPKKFRQLAFIHHIPLHGHLGFSIQHLPAKFSHGVPILRNFSRFRGQWSDERRAWMG